MVNTALVVFPTRPFLYHAPFMGLSFYYEALLPDGSHHRIVARVAWFDTAMTLNPQRGVADAA